jgi:SAM-dependent methyltransferase
MTDPYQANRGAFSDPGVVAAYSAMADLTAAEDILFSKYLAAGMDVLDLGVGAGRTTASLRSLGGRYVAIDFSAEMVAAATRSHPGADIREGDASDLSAFSDGSFDAVVFSFNGIDNLFPDALRRRCVSECVRVLTDRGVFIFSSHNAGFWLKPFRPRRPGISLAKGVVGGLYRSMQLASRRLVQRSLWRGRGYAHDPAHGGIVQHEALRRHVIAECRELGLELLEVLPSSSPNDHWSIAVPWYYYAFRRAEDASRVPRRASQ